jgi:hypothetical protein
MTPIDNGQNDPITLDLTWADLEKAAKAREHIKKMNGRNEDLTDIPEAA